MAAKIYSAPEAIKKPKLDFKNMGKYREDEKTYRENLSKYLKRRKSGDLIGKTIRFQVADGYAEYMVAGLKPVELVHLDLMDGYQSEFAELLTAAKVKEMIEREEALNRLFSKKG